MPLFYLREVLDLSHGALPICWTQVMQLRWVSARSLSQKNERGKKLLKVKTITTNLMFRKYGDLSTNDCSAQKSSVWLCDFVSLAPCILAVSVNVSSAVLCFCSTSKAKIFKLSLNGKNQALDMTCPVQLFITEMS